MVKAADSKIGLISRVVVAECLARPPAKQEKKQQILVILQTSLTNGILPCSCFWSGLIPTIAIITIWPCYHCIHTWNRNSLHVRTEQSPCSSVLLDQTKPEGFSPGWRDCFYYNTTIVLHNRHLVLFTWNNTCFVLISWCGQSVFVETDKQSVARQPYLYYLAMGCLPHSTKTG